MPGIISTTLASRLVRLQTFKEVVWGTPSLATARWMAVQPFPQFKPYQKSTLFDEDRGSLQNNFLSAVLQDGGEFSMNAHCTFEDMNFILQGGMQAVSPTGVNPYTWAYAAPTDAAYYVQSYTFEHGYDQGTIGVSGAMFNKWSIKSSAKKQWEVSAGGFFKTYYPNSAMAIASSTAVNPSAVTTSADHGLTSGMRVVISGHTVNTAINGSWTVTVTGANTFTVPVLGIGGGGAATGTVTKTQTPAIADRDVEVILFPGTTLKMEAQGGTLGTTSYSNQFLGFSLDYTPGLMPIYGSDTKSPIAWTYAKATPTLSMKLLYTPEIKAFINTTLKAGQRAVTQIKNISGAKSAELDFAGVLADDPSYYPNEQDAVAVDIKLEGQYEPVSIANQLKATWINAVSTLP